MHADIQIKPGFTYINYFTTPTRLRYKKQLTKNQTTY